MTFASFFLSAISRKPTIPGDSRLIPWSRAEATFFHRYTLDQDEFATLNAVLLSKKLKEL
jgi:hypothetical protein